MKDTQADPRDRFDIIRKYQDPSKASRIILRCLTLQEAQAHCESSETSSITCTTPKAKAITRKNGQWFDIYQLSK